MRERCTDESVRAVEVHVKLVVQVRRRHIVNRAELRKPTLFIGVSRPSRLD